MPERLHFFWLEKRVVSIFVALNRLPVAGTNAGVTTSNLKDA
jgi:hypothetical protein